jgi:murein endopeptidase
MARPIAVSLSRIVAVAALLAVPVVLSVLIHAHRPPAVPRQPAARVERVPPPRLSRPDAAKRQRRWPRVEWRASTPLGSPSAGRLLAAVRLPAEGAHFATWDPALKRSPNRWWRRNGTDGLVRVLLRVSARFAAAHPNAPRVLIGDLSRPRGGDFGRRFGPLGHVSHQNGLDADVYFPRRDRRERAARRIGQVDRALAQDLVDRFVQAGAQRIFVGAGLRLRDRTGVVQPWPNHDDHLHMRFAPFASR